MLKIEEKKTSKKERFFALLLIVGMYLRSGSVDDMTDHDSWQGNKIAE